MQPIVNIDGSSNVTGIGYDPTTQTLAVRFKSGKTYNYQDVPPQVHKDFMAAPSKGSFFATNVKGKFGTPSTEAAA